MLYYIIIGRGAWVVSKKKLIIIFVAALITFFIWFINRDEPIDYENYDSMQLLSQKDHDELKKLGYSDSSIEKIKYFNNNYENHLKLLNMVKNNEFKHLGYDNRDKVDENGDFGFIENHFDIQDDYLTYNTTVMDFIYDENSERDVGRIGICFEWKIKPYAQKQTIAVEFPNYVTTDVYTLLTYVNFDDKNDIVYRMCEIDSSTFVQEFSTDFNSKINIDKSQYILESGLIVLDIKSFYGEGIAPIKLYSNYLSKPFLMKDKVISGQIIEVSSQM